MFYNVVLLYNYKVVVVVVVCYNVVFLGENMYYSFRGAQCTMIMFRGTIFPEIFILFNNSFFKFSCCFNFGRA